MIVHKLIHKARVVAKGIEIGILKRRALRHGYEVKSKEPIRIVEIVIENYFKTTYKKSALLSYLVYPFIDPMKNSHSNYMECYMIAEALNELEYNVDIINWNDAQFKPLKDYQIIIDNHNNLERLYPYFSNNLIKIFHATNAHWLYQNKTEIDRHYEYYLKTGIALTPTRLLPAGNSAAYCNAISMLGNSFTKETFGKYADKVNYIPISITTIPERIERQEISEIRYNFLWFNSAGFLLKGLDIVLDTFISQPAYKLFVCGLFEREAEFLDSYADRLKACKNIKMIGWVDIESESFLGLAKECMWVINTSFSEGGGGSTLNCMAKGLIPIVSKSASIDIIENETGFYVEENSSAGLSKKIDQVTKLSEERLQKYSENAINYTRRFHKKEKFKAAYKTFLTGLISASVTS